MKSKISQKSQISDPSSHLSNPGGLPKGCPLGLVIWIKPSPALCVLLCPGLGLTVCTVLSVLSNNSSTPLNEVWGDRYWYCGDIRSGMIVLSSLYGFMFRCKSMSNVLFVSPSRRPGKTVLFLFKFRSWGVGVCCLLSMWKVLSSLTVRCLASCSVE